MTPDEERLEAAHSRLGHPSRSWNKINTVLILVLIVWTLIREVQIVEATEGEEGVRETLVPFAVQVETECADPEIAKMAPDVCKRAEEIIEDPDNADIVTVGGAPGQDATDEQVQAAVDQRLSPLLQDLLSGQLPALISSYFKENPVSPGEPGRDGVDGEDGVDGADGIDGAPGPAGPTCPGDATPLRWHFPGTANIDLPKGTYLICPAG